MITKRYVRDSTSTLGPIEEQSICSSTSDETLTSDASPRSFRTSSWDSESYDNGAQKTSCYSFQEDRFDRLASDDVLHMFEAIDSELYEDDVIDESSHKSRLRFAREGRRVEKSRERRLNSNSVAPSITLGQQLQRECVVELKTAFPHFRICGVSVVGACDDGVQMYSSRSTSAKSQTSTKQQQNFGRQGLTVMGRNVESLCPFTSSESLHLSFEEEEIFAIDGKMEETIAVDYRNCEEMTQRSNTLQWGGGIPPVTPLGCIRSNIMDSIFDVAWKVVVFQIQEFLCLHILKSSQMGLSKARLNTASSCRQRLSSPVFEEQPESSILNLDKPIRTIRRDQYALTSLLRIQPKALTTREKLEPNILSLASVNTSSPSTSDILFLQVTGNSSRLGDPLTSPGRRNVIKERLEAIHDNDNEVSSGPSTRFEIRGHGLPFSTRIEPLSSLSFLPPIGSELQRITSSVSSSSHIGNKTPASLRRPTYRVNSAFVPKSQRLLPERPATQSTSRPVTGGASKLEISAIPMNLRRFSSTQSATKRNICVLESVIAPSGSSVQPHVRGIALHRYHTVIS